MRALRVCKIIILTAKVVQENDKKRCHDVLIHMPMRLMRNLKHQIILHTQLLRIVIVVVVTLFVLCNEILHDGLEVPRG